MTRLRDFLSWCYKNPRQKRELLLKRTQETLKVDYLEGYLQNSFRYIETYLKFGRVLGNKMIFGNYR